MGDDLTHVNFHGTATTRSRAARRVARVRADIEDQFESRSAGSSAIGALAASVLRRGGVNPAHYRDVPLSRRVPACLRALRVACEETALAHVSEKTSASQTALDALLIGVSEFFRDPAVFDSLRTEVIPTLGDGSGPRRVLSVGCSSGAELYSMAILLADAGLLDRSELVGVDCRDEAIRQARRAEFSDSSIAHVNERQLASYFERAGERWRLTSALRQRASWHVADATAGIPAGPWHVILCRNLFIYLTADMALRMSGWMADALVPGGRLVLGKAEPLSGRDDLTYVSRCVYRKHGD
jgi:chemotaxis protein methyltransferase CheR